MWASLSFYAHGMKKKNKTGGNLYNILLRLKWLHLLSMVFPFLSCDVVSFLTLDVIKSSI